MRPKLPTDFRAFSKSKKIFEMHRADCLLVLKQTDDEVIDSYVTDPPYGIELKLGTRRRGRRSIAGDGKAQARELWKRMIPEAFRTAKNNTAHVFFGTWNSALMHDLLAQHFTVKGCIVWDKRIIGLGYYIRPRWELAFYCHKGKPPIPEKADCDVWSHPRMMRTIHPCQKPIDLLRRAVRLVAPPQAIICDPFGGIFSTGVAAVMEGRRFFGVEIDPRFYKLGVARVHEATKDFCGQGRNPPL